MLCRDACAPSVESCLARLRAPGLLFFLALATATLLLASPAAGASMALTGRTSQGKPVSFQLSSNRLKITRFQITWTAACAGGARYSDTSTVDAIRVHPSHRFDATSTYTSTSASYSAAQGRSLSFAVSATLAGRLRHGGRASGSWGAEVRVLDANHQQVDICNVVSIVWKTRRR